MTTTPATSTAASETPSLYSVEFYPDIDDYVYIASRFGGSVSTSTTGFYAYYAFLLLNGIGFPAFLLFVGQTAAALVLFILNALLVIILIPRANPEAYRKFYEDLHQNAETHLTKVTLSNDGLLCECESSTSFWPWKSIHLIEESEEAIYFFFETNGLEVRKNGFAYPLQASEFVEFARGQILPALQSTT